MKFNDFCKQFKYNDEKFDVWKYGKDRLYLNDFEFYKKEEYTNYASCGYYLVELFKCCVFVNLSGDVLEINNKQIFSQGYPFIDNYAIINMDNTIYNYIIDTKGNLVKKIKGEHGINSVDVEQDMSGNYYLTFIDGNYIYVFHKGFLTHHNRLLLQHRLEDYFAYVHKHLDLYDLIFPLERYIIRKIL